MVVTVVVGMVVVMVECASKALPWAGRGPAGYLLGAAHEAYVVGMMGRAGQQGVSCSATATGQWWMCCGTARCGA